MLRAVCFRQSRPHSRPSPFGQLWSFDSARPASGTLHKAPGGTAPGSMVPTLAAFAASNLPSGVILIVNAVQRVLGGNRRRSGVPRVAPGAARAFRRGRAGARVLLRMARASGARQATHRRAARAGDQLAGPALSALGADRDRPGVARGRRSMPALSRAQAHRRRRDRPDRTGARRHPRGRPQLGGLCRTRSGRRGHDRGRAAVLAVGRTGLCRRCWLRRFGGRGSVVAAALRLPRPVRREASGGPDRTRPRLCRRSRPLAR